jgi:sulfide dehydrogenase cytochrome subunit
MRPNQPVPIIELVAVAALSGNPLQAETDPIELTRGAMLSNSCAACHGTDGNSPGEIPSIGGKSARFIETALQEYRSGKRTGTVMGRHASAYSDEEIRLIAEFFAHGN